MNTCRQVGKGMPDFASLPPALLPAEIARHLAACPACCRALAAMRMARGLVAVLADAAEPPTQFVGRVLWALPVGHLPAPVPADPWRLAWGLVPAFAAMVAGVFLIYQTTRRPDVPGLLPTDGLPASERLVLGPSAPEPDLVLAAVLEGDAP